MALLRAKPSHLALINSSVSHLVRCGGGGHHPAPLAAPSLIRHFRAGGHSAPVAAPALTRQFRAGRSRDEYPSSSAFSYEAELPANWGIRIVPQQKAYVVERFGKYLKTLVGGIHLLIPFVDRIAYIHSLKEESFAISEQTAITHDNVSLLIDGLVYVRVVDPYRASYEVENPILMVRQLAQTTVRSELGKMELDTVFKERDNLNEKIVSAINEAAAGWGVKCLRYEIKDINPPPGVLQAMEMQVEAERRKRAKILEAEGEKESHIKKAEGNRQSAILAAQGEARAILERSQATAEGLRKLSEALKTIGGSEAATLILGQEYIRTFGNIAKKGTTVLLPAGSEGSSSVISQAATLFKILNKKISAAGVGHANSSSVSTDDTKFDDLSSHLSEVEVPVPEDAAPDRTTDPEVKLFSLQSPQKHQD